MKKIIALVIALVMCLGLTACGSSEAEELYDKYEGIINDLESSEFEDAAEKVMELYEKYNESTADEKQKLDPEAKKYADMLCSEWIVDEYAESEQPLTVSFSEDGKCTVGEAELQWKLRESYETWAEFTLKNGDTLLYSFTIDTSEDRVRAVLYDHSSEEFGESIAQCFRAEDYTAIEVTVDNFDEYFELVTYTERSENSFGETTSMSVYYSYLLKESYGKVNDEISNVAIEYSYLEPRYELASADLDAGTYELGDPAPFDFEEEPYTQTTAMRTDYNTERYGFSLGSTWIQADSERVYVPQLSEILRLAGTVYTYAE